MGAGPSVVAHDDPAAGGIVAGHGAALVVDFDEVEGVGRGDPEEAAALGDAARMLGLGGEPGNDGAVAVVELVQGVVDLVDYPEAAVRSLESVGLRAGGQPAVPDFIHLLCTSPLDLAV